MFKSCASSVCFLAGAFLFWKKKVLFLSHVLAVVLPGRGLCFLEKEVPGFPDAAAAVAGTILDSGLAPPLTPRDGISRKGKPLAPIKFGLHLNLEEGPPSGERVRSLILPLENIVTRNSDLSKK